ncbi:CHAT domain-containing protein [Parafrankia elaeagni]|uniref:CHAT domain-containing protein n=1 Tax=Parafrankia elaeagni TaxID=222534 RepID=UPI00037416F9|nr:CHAT domain-containing protein [Parafrankia elaeagni]
MARLRERLALFSMHQDPEVILDPAALVDVEMLTDEVPDLVGDLEVLSAIGLLHWCRYLTLDAGQDRADLTRALALLAPLYWIDRASLPGVVLAFFEEHQPPRPDSPESIADRAIKLLEHSQTTGDLALLDDALPLLRSAVAALPPDSRFRTAHLANLTTALANRFERTGDLADLDEATAVGREALGVLNRDDPTSSVVLTNLCAVLLQRFSQTQDHTDLDASITMSRDAASCSSDSASLASSLSTLSAGLLLRFTLRGDLADLEESIESGCEGTRLSSPDDGHHSARLATLGNAFAERFERLGETGDLDAAVAVFRESVSAARAAYPDSVGFLAGLARVLTLRFSRLGRMADIDQAVALGRKVVATTPLGHSKRAVRLAALGNALQARFVRSGDLADLDAAIGVGWDAAKDLGADHQHRAATVANLGIALQSRFEQTGSGADLDAAISNYEQAVVVTPPGHPDHAGYLIALGQSLRLRFQRTENIADIDAAVAACREAVAVTPHDHPDRLAMLSNLSVVAQFRFAETEDMGDIDEVIAVGTEVVRACPSDHPLMSRYQANLSGAISARALRSGDTQDFDAAVKAGRAAIGSSPADHPERVRHLINLGESLRSRAEPLGVGGRTGDTDSWEADLREAIECGRQAAAIANAPPRERVVAARLWARAAAQAGRWREAAEGLDVAVSLAGLVAPRSLDRSDQEHQIEELGRLGSDAAACCVRAGQVDRAVELFEQGRGILLGQALESRTDLTVLTERHPNLARRFIAARDALDQPSAGAATPILSPADTASDSMHARHRRPDDSARTQRRRDAATAFTGVLADIRAMPGFERFLSPPLIRDLTAVSVDGPVVVVTVSTYGSYALIVTGGGVDTPIPLTTLTPEIVTSQVTAFITALDEGTNSPAAGAPAERVLAEILGWLWDELAGPVFARLGITGPPAPGEPWPRVWWCLSGLLSFLPVHAAGHHTGRDDPEPATVMDRAVSSYTPTIRALGHARRHDTAAAGASIQDRGLIVAMPRTPGASDLPGATAEAAAVSRHHTGHLEVIVGAEATRRSVLAAMKRAQWAHFACHGDADFTHPSASHLLLNDHQESPLTVIDVSRLRLDARLAFLSACSTAQSSGRLLDEAIHLASAFHLAGYRHVVGTLWPINDALAVSITDDIYARLVGSAPTDVAGALHAVARQQRARLVNRPSTWASHVHIGV